MPPKPSPLAIPLANHRAAVREYAALARRLPADLWLHPPAPAKWSPAQITEHVALGIEIFTDDLAGRPGLTPRLSPWKQFLPRIFLMPRVLRSGQLPAGANAPRLLRPSTTPLTQDDALRRLEVAVATLEATAAAIPNTGATRLTHPAFGRVPVLAALRLLELHVRHHFAQLPRRADV